jgi:hypothetical protein
LFFRNGTIPLRKFYASAQEQAEAPVYKSGGSWTYRAIDKPIGSSTSNVLTGDFEITFQEGKRRIFRLEDGQKVEEDNPRELTLMLPTKGIIASDTQYFPFPLTVGKKWTAKYYSKPLSKWITPQSSVTGIETITIPAGTFSAFRIERHTSYSTGSTFLGFRNWNWTHIYFYSPQTQSVVKYHFQNEVQSEGGSLTLDRTIDIELIKLDAANPK